MDAGNPVHPGLSSYGYSVSLVTAKRAEAEMKATGAAHRMRDSAAGGKHESRLPDATLGIALAILLLYLLYISMP